MTRIRIGMTVRVKDNDLMASDRSCGAGSEMYNMRGKKYKVKDVGSNRDDNQIVFINGWWFDAEDLTPSISKRANPNAKFKKKFNPKDLQI